MGFNSAFKGLSYVNLNLLTTTIVAPPSNAGKWQMGFNSAFEGLKQRIQDEVAAIPVEMPREI